MPSPERYDETFTASKIGRAQRASVWKELGRAFRSGDRVLEIGCGTGVDACFLGDRGVSVIACDSSPQMVAVTTRRVKEREKIYRFTLVCWRPKILADCKTLARSTELSRTSGR